MADEKKYTFRCTVCGWEVTVDTPELPEDCVCEVCGVGPDLFELVEEESFSPGAVRGAASRGRSPLLRGREGRLRPVRSSRRRCARAAVAMHREKRVE